MRGDRPLCLVLYALLWLFTPHARGSTRVPKRFFHHVNVYPACAGIDLLREDYIAITVGLPRMRGDRPFLHNLGVHVRLFTPHARGSTYTILIIL